MSVKGVPPLQMQPSRLYCPNGIPHVCNDQCITMTTRLFGLVAKHWCVVCIDFQKMHDSLATELPRRPQTTCVHGKSVWAKCEECAR